MFRGASMEPLQWEGVEERERGLWRAKSRRDRERGKRKRRERDEETREEMGGEERKGGMYCAIYGTIQDTRL